MATWINEELEQIKANNKNNAKFMRFDVNTCETVTINLEKKPETVKDGFGKEKQRLIVSHAGESKFWDLGKNNPIYHQILQKGKDLNATSITVKIIRTGENKETKYTLLKE
jgi:hypothetical protein